MEVKGNLVDAYADLKAAGTADKKSYINLLLVNGTPALRVKILDPVTGKYVQDAQATVDVQELKKIVAMLQARIDNFNILIADAEELVR